MQDQLHDGLPDVLSIDNLANGAVYEMLGEAFQKLAENVADPNTKAEQKRQIKITIDVSPYKDRTGAEYSVKVENKLAGIRPAEGTMYIARKGGSYLAFGKNINQTNIEFDMPAVDGKTAATKPQ